MVIDMKKLHIEDAEAVESPPQVFRKTLAYNDEVMLCSFSLKKGAKIPLHEHRASQIGYIISGQVEFIAEDEADYFIAKTGDAYVFDPHQKHGLVALEDTFYIEAFSPARKEYKDF